MATINYKFSDGHIGEIEVTEKFAREYEKIEREFNLNEQREKKRASRKRVSLELLIESGWDIVDPNAADPLEVLMEKEQNKITLITLADFLTARQKEVMTLYYEKGYTKVEIAKKLAISKNAVQHHLEDAAKKILRNF